MIYFALAWSFNSKDLSKYELTRIMLTGSGENNPFNHFNGSSD